MKLQTPDVELNIVEDGDPDKPPVLILHGITQSTMTWDWLVPHVADDHRVLRLDFRGHGESGRTPGAYTYAGYVADATAVCEQIIGAPAVLIGHSLGGGTSAALAQRRPDLVRGIVLEDAALMPGGDRDATELDGNSLVDGFALLRESVPGFQAQGLTPTDLAAGLVEAPRASGATMGEELCEDSILAMATSLLQLDASVLDAVLQGTIEPVFDRDQPVTVPGIVLAADPASPDAVTGPDDLAALAEHSPQLEQRIVAGAGHLIHDERTGRPHVLRAVQDLLTRLD